MGLFVCSILLIHTIGAKAINMIEGTTFFIKWQCGCRCERLLPAEHNAAELQSSHLTRAHAAYGNWNVLNDNELFSIALLKHTSPWPIFSSVF